MHAAGIPAPPGCGFPAGRKSIPSREICCVPPTGLKKALRRVIADPCCRKASIWVRSRHEGNGNHKNQDPNPEIVRAPHPSPCPKRKSKYPSIIREVVKISYKCPRPGPSVVSLPSLAIRQPIRSHHRHAPPARSKPVPRTAHRGFGFEPAKLFLFHPGQIQTHETASAKDVMKYKSLFDDRKTGAR